MDNIMDQEPEFLTPTEVARLFRVDRNTVSWWTRTGKLLAVRTPGGRPRYRSSVVRALLTEAHGEGVSV